MLKTTTVEEFHALSESEQRVYIARDVLLRLETNNFHPRQGTYLMGPQEGVPGAVKDLQLPYSGPADMRERLRELPPCTGCALGALFLCTVDRANKLSVEDVQALRLSRYPSATADEAVLLNDSTVLRDYLTRYFDSEQLDMIERAFEERYHDFGEDYGVVQKILFEVDLHPAPERLIAIMLNIVANDGVFRPDMDNHRAELEKWLGGQGSVAK